MARHSGGQTTKQAGAQRPLIQRERRSARSRRTPMATVSFKGTPVSLEGSEVRTGQRAPDFTALDTSLQPVRLGAASGKVLILSSVPSLDTPVCDTETR